MNYSWNIRNVNRLVDTGFVVTVYYEVIAKDGEYQESIVDSVGYANTDESFVPYEQLTNELVIDWVQKSVGKERLEKMLAEKIEAQTKVLFAHGLPWQ